MGGNIKSFEKPFKHAEVVALAKRTLKRFGGDRNAAGRYARAMEDRYESAKWAQVVEVIATSGRYHATMKTSPAQLDRDIAEALSSRLDRSIIVRPTSTRWPGGVKVRVVKFGPDVRQGVRAVMPVGSLAVMHPDAGEKLPDGTVRVHEDELRDTAD